MFLPEEKDFHQTTYLPDPLSIAPPSQLSGHPEPHASYSESNRKTELIKKAKSNIKHICSS